jgi:succinate dehydrogenase / fumarate reductase, cytochrome b subunit
LERFDVGPHGVGRADAGSRPDAGVAAFARDRARREVASMYRGREGQWAFLFHRISGVAIALYLLLHVLDISLVMFGPDGPFDAFLAFYHNWPFRIGLLMVIAGVVYHALNGLRIIVMDFTTWGVRVQRELWYGVLALTTIIGIPVLWVIVPQILGGV